MTDHETKYRDLVAGLEKMIATAPVMMWSVGMYPVQAVPKADLLALLASPPAEKEGEGRHQLVMHLSRSSAIVDWSCPCGQFGVGLGEANAEADYRRHIPDPVSSGEASECCGHIHAPEGCTGPRTPSDIRAGVSVAQCDCDHPAPVVTPRTEGDEP